MTEKIAERKVESVRFERISFDTFKVFFTYRNEDLGSTTRELDVGDTLTVYTDIKFSVN